MIRVKLIDLEAQGILVHIHIIPDLLGLLVVHIRRRRLLHRLQRRRPDSSPPPIVLIGSIIRNKIGPRWNRVSWVIGYTVVVGVGVVNWRGRGWVRRIRDGRGRRIRIGV